MRGISTADWAMAFANKYPLAHICIWKSDLIYDASFVRTYMTNLKSYVDKTLMFLHFPFNIVAVNKNYFF